MPSGEVHNQAGGAESRQLLFPPFRPRREKVLMLPRKKYAAKMGVNTQRIDQIKGGAAYLQTLSVAIQRILLGKSK